MAYAVVRMEAQDLAEVMHAMRALLRDAGLSVVADGPTRDTSEVALDVSPADCPWAEAMDVMESRLDPKIWSD